MAINPLSRNTPAINPSTVSDVGQTAPNEAKQNVKADGVAKQSFAGKTVSLISKAIRSGVAIAIKGSFAIAKATVLAAFRVGKALVNAINTAGKSSKSSLEVKSNPKALQNRKPSTIKDVKEAQKNLASAIAQGKETIAKQKAAQKDRREIADLERRAKALKQDAPAQTKKPNQDYTNFEKSSSTLSANANLSAQDKKDIAALEKRLNDLKKP